MRFLHHLVRNNLIYLAVSASVMFCFRGKRKNNFHDAGVEISGSLSASPILLLFSFAFSSFSFYFYFFFLLNFRIWFCCWVLFILWHNHCNSFLELCSKAIHILEWNCVVLSFITQVWKTIVIVLLIKNMNVKKK